MLIIRLMIIVIFACIAASGTFPYGWRFAALIPLSSTYAHFFLAALFALTATLANAALGTYSLLNAFSNKFNLPYLGLSVLAAIPMGFICFVGYETLLDLMWNMLISFVVVIVNAGINYTALKNAASSLVVFFKKRTENLDVEDSGKLASIVRICGISAGIIVSLTISLATIDRMVIILSFAKFNMYLTWGLSYFIGILLWIPNAALFANSTQKVAIIILNYPKRIHEKIENLKSSILLFVFASLSGGAFAEMTLEFSSVSRQIPLFLKGQLAQLILHGVITPLAFFVIAAVNFIALSRLLPLVKEAIAKKINSIDKQSSSSVMPN